MTPEQIKAERTKRGWTQDELAHMIGKSDKSVIYKLEAGINKITQSTALLLETVFKD